MKNRFVDPIRYLTSFELENFKAFGERVKLEFAPITLLFGQNSAGKSSILQALRLLQQSILSPNDDGALIVNAEGGVSLGSFHEMVFNHDVQRRIAMKLQFAGTNRISDFIPAFESELGRKFISSGIEYGFSYYKQPNTINVDQIKLFAGEGWEHFGSWSDPTKPEQCRSGDCLEFLNGEVKACIGFWKPIWELWHKHRNEIADFILSAIEDEDYDKHHFSLDHLKAALKFYRKDFTVAKFAERMTEHIDGEALYATGLFLEDAGNKDSLPFELAGRAWVAGPLSKLARFDWESFLHIYNTDLKNWAEDFVSMAPFRHQPQRFYSVSSSSPTHTGYWGEKVPELLFRNTDLLEKTNKWMQDLDLGYKIGVESFGRYDQLLEVRLEDTKSSNNVNVSLSDVGFGVSQLLPFVVQSLLLENSTLTIEQPEVHVHPKLQADLGDLLVESIHARSNRFIIETHSEHLMLRLQRLVREGKLSHEDVSVLYVERGENGSRVDRLKLDEEGDFIDEWPGGFFPERLKELS